MTTAGIRLADDVAALLSSRFSAVVELEGPPRISVEAHVDVARVLRDDMGYRLFGFVVASHHPSSGDEGKSTETIRLVYALRKPGSMTKLAAWQLEVEAGQSVPSLVSLFAGADWQEREQFDLIGIRFQDHPDLRRLMLSEDWQGHPLRKDYAIDTEVAPWR